LTTKRCSCITRSLGLHSERWALATCHWFKG